MKTYKIEEQDVDFLILGVNSHIKLHKLCWTINKHLRLNFIKTKNHINPNNNKQSFQRFIHYDENTDTQYNILSNVCSEGHLDPTNKSVNYFVVVQGGLYNSGKIIKSLNKIEEILLVFELNLSKIKSITPFIIND